MHFAELHPFFQSPFFFVIESRLRLNALANALLYADTFPLRPLAFPALTDPTAAPSTNVPTRGAGMPVTAAGYISNWSAMLLRKKANCWSVSAIDNRPHCWLNASAMLAAAVIVSTVHSSTTERSQSSLNVEDD